MELKKYRNRISTAIVIFCSCILFLSACQKKADEVVVVPYNLSETNFIEKEKEIPYDVEGILGIPKEDNCPVVFIIHGNHLQENGIATPIYKGFEYLVKELAENGYLAVSINVNRAYSPEPIEGDEVYRTREIFKTHYEKLAAAVSGKKIFPYSLKGKADLSRINLIGHSRGGEHITNIASNMGFRDISFVSAVKIAATDNYGLKENYADLPTALILPQYDGDVSSLESIGQYYFAYEEDQARRTPILSAYLYGANHNAFNTEVNQKELTEFEGVTFLEPEVQRDFLKKFTIDFLDIYNKKDGAMLETFDNNLQKKYGIDFMTAVYSDGKKLIVPDAFMRDFKVNDIDMEFVTSSRYSWKNTAGAFNPPGNPDELPLYRINWDRKEGSIEIPIDSIFYEVDSDKILSLYMALDSSDSRNSWEKETAFDFILTDVNGRKESISLSSANTPALKYQPGKLEEYEEGIKTWSYYTPLGTELIPMNQWDKEFVTDNIVSFTIVPKSDTGSVMLGGIDLYNKDN